MSSSSSSASHWGYCWGATQTDINSAGLLEISDEWSKWLYKGTTTEARHTGDYGTLLLASGEEFVSDVKDLGSSQSRYLRLPFDQVGALVAEDDCADDDTADWDGIGALIFNTDHYELSGGVGVIFGLLTPSIQNGSKYRISVEVKDGSGSDMLFNLVEIVDGSVISSSDVITTTAIYTKYSFEFTASGVGTKLCGFSSGAVWGGNSIYFKNFRVVKLGKGSGTLQWRGHNTTPFSQDSNPPASPSWENYTPSVKTWRYVQVKVS